jgi:glycosyltransferase involved in cell wall biosynthesis
MTPLNDPLVSVVVTTKNEERHIGNCLESVARQTYSSEGIEMIVVDNSSTDRTKKIARRYTDKIFDKGPERSAQRNFGMIEKSRGKYVLFLDADMILSPTVIEKSVAKLEGGGFIALYIPEVVLGSSFWSRVRRFERSFYDGTVVDCVRIIRKDTFRKVGGFDLRMTGQEDWDLDKKIRSIGAVGLVDTYNLQEINERLKGVDYHANNLAKELAAVSENGLLYHNEADFSVKKYIVKKGYYLEELFYIERWGKNDPDVRRQFGFVYRFFGVFVEDGKWRKLLHSPILAGGMYFLRFLVGVRFLLANLRS